MYLLFVYEEAVMADIVELVLKDHRAVDELFEQLTAASGAEEQAGLYAQVKKMLEAHANAEEKVLYPRVRGDVPDGGDEAKDAVEEHDQIRASIKEVDEHEAGTELFMLAVAQL